MSGTGELTLAVGDYLCQSSYGLAALMVTGVFLFSPRMLAGLGGWVAVRSGEVRWGTRHAAGARPLCPARSRSPSCSRSNYLPD